MTLGVPEFVGREFSVPSEFNYALSDWVGYGHDPGEFLKAVLALDLIEAICTAPDARALRNLAAFPVYLANNAPPECWGSPAKVAAWPAIIAKRRGA
jgi:hypothetical protein